MATHTMIADGSASFGIPGNDVSHIPVIGSNSCPQIYWGPDDEKLVECGRCGVCGDCGRRVV